MNKGGRPRKSDNTRSINDVTQEVMEEIKPQDVQDIPEPTNAPPVSPPPTSSIPDDSTAGGFNPLAENVIQRDYSNPPIDHGLTGDIEEPIFVPPSYDENIGQEGGGYVEPESPFVNPNPALNELDPQEQRVACEMLVDTILDGYEQLHEVGKYIAKVDEGELYEKQMQGKINLETQRVPISEDGTSVSLGEFVQTYNGQANEALTYDKEFGKKVRPAMVRLFTKNGWGMTDGQYLGFMFGKDVITKGVMIYQMKKAFNMVLSGLEKQYKYENEQQQAYEPEPEQPRPQSQKPQRPVPTVEAEALSDEESFQVRKKSPGRPKKDPSVQKMKIDYPGRVKTDPIPKEVIDGQE